MAAHLAEWHGAGQGVASPATEPVTDRLDAVIALLTAIRDQPVGPGKLGNHFPDSSQAPQAVMAPSKQALAEQWFTDHPADRERTGRDLEQHVRPMGVRISYRTWNDAKKAH
jgi:hypothetical protein